MLKETGFYSIIENYRLLIIRPMKKRKFSGQEDSIE